MKRNSFIILLGVVIVLLVAGIASNAYWNQPSAAPFPPAPTGTTTGGSINNPPPAESSALTFKVGQKIQTANFSLTLHAITEDSRCPANVNCIWAGRVAAEFDAVSGKHSQRIVLTNDSATAFAGYDFKIESVKPQKTKSQNIPSDYTLSVSYVSNN